MFVPQPICAQVTALRALHNLFVLPPFRGVRMLSVFNSQPTQPATPWAELSASQPG